MVSGSCCGPAPAFGRRSRHRANSACQALSATTRTGSAWRRVGAGDGVDNEQLAALEVGAGPVEEAVERGQGERLVDGAPGNLIARRRLLDEEAVLGRTAGVGAGVGDERAGFGQAAFAALQGVFDEEWGRQVGPNVPARAQAEDAQVRSGGRRRFGGRVADCHARTAFRGGPADRAAEG